MYDPDAFPVKIDTEVELMFLDRATMRGRFFVSRGQRVADVLNDARTFLPFADISGAVRLINKSTIVQVKPTQQDNGGREKGRPVGWTPI
jgi:hypothetical protein